MKNILLITVIYFFNLPLHAENNQLSNADAFAKINQTGLNFVTKVVEDESLSNIVNQIIPGIQETTNGVRITVDPSILNVVFDRLELIAINNKIRAKIYIKKAELRATHIKFKKRILGATLRSTCRDTTVKIEHSSPLAVSGDISLAVQANGKLKSNVTNVLFSIPDSAYKTYGPRKCSGDIGIGSLIRSLVKSTLKKNKSKIEQLVREQAREISKNIEVEANKFIPFNFPLTFPENNFFSSIESNLIAKLKNIEIKSGSINIGLKTDITSKKLTPNKFRHFAKENNTIQKIADIGIHLNFLNKAIQQFHSAFNKDFELEGRDIHKVLNTTSTASIWPDLNEVSFDRKHLRAFAELDVSPQIVRSEMSTIKLRVPNLGMRFQTFKGSEWPNYTKLSFDLDVDLNINNTQTALNLDLEQTELSNISGSWAYEYTPVFDFIDVESAEILFFSLAEYLNAENQSFDLNIDLDLLNNYNLSANRLHVNSQDYLQFSLYK